MMAQLGDIPPEQRRAKGLTFDKIEVNGETAGLYVGIWHQNMGENGVMEAHYGEIAPHLRRGHGIGSLMIANAIKESYERGGNGHIFLKSHTDAIPFYKKLGMNFIGGPQNIFDATPDLAGELYKRITGEELGGATKKPSRSKKTVAPDNTPLAKSIDTDTDDDTPVRPQKSTIDPSLKTFDDFVKLEDSLSTGFMLGDFNERMKSEFKTPYDDPDDSNDSDDDPDYSDVSDDDQE
jgi:hypothetical protein